MADASLDEQHLNKKSQGSQHKWKIGQMAPEQMALDELVISCCIDTPRLGKRQLCQILLKDHGNTPIGCTQTFRILILVRRCLSLENRKEEYAYLYFGYFGLFPLLNAMICSSPAYSRKKNSSVCIEYFYSLYVQ